MGNMLKWGRGVRLVMRILTSVAVLALNLVQIARVLGWL